MFKARRGGILGVIAMEIAKKELLEKRDPNARTGLGIRVRFQGLGLRVRVYTGLRTPCARSQNPH